MLKYKILFVANIHNHFNSFHIPHIRWLTEQGYEVHCAANGTTSVPLVSKQHFIPLQRGLWSFENVKAYKALKKIIDTENYDLVHCHTSMGGAIGRLASIKHRRLGKKVLFTSHEFPFYDNWMLKNWFTYFPIEVLLANLTDGIISINQFDYNLLTSGLFNCKYKYKISGIGVDAEKFKLVTIEEKASLRKKYGFSQDDFILIYAAEHTQRKNHNFIMEAIPLLKDLPNLKVIFTGRGILHESNKRIAEERKIDNIIFTGYVDSIKGYMALADVGISSSFGEGLGINLVEELFLGIPIIASNNKGHREIIIDGVNGFVFNKGDHQKFVKSVSELNSNRDLYREMAAKAPKTADKFSIHSSIEEMSIIYRNFLK
jgi:glycosyltransferase EpsD